MSTPAPPADVRLWARVPPGDGSARLRLFCIPHAGGSASAFSGWDQGLPLDVQVCPVQLPGRQNRLAEVPFTRMESLVAALAAVLAKCDDLPFVLLGHSMGGLAAFELARELRRIGAPPPAALVATGCRAPHLPAGTPRIAALSDADFVSALRRFNGIPDGILDQPELVELLMPALRADFALCEAYRFHPAPQLDCPIFAYGGKNVGDVRFDQLAPWHVHTTGPFRIRTFAGGHFFIDESRTEVLAALGEDLSNV